MQVAYHIGVHGTDDDRINRCLELNRDLLVAEGIEVSPRETNDPILSEALTALKGGLASREMEQVVLDALLTGDHVRRLVISRANMVATRRRALDGGEMLRGAGERMRALCGVFPSAECSVFMALKNPVTYLADLLGRGTALPADIDPLALRWSDTVKRLVQALDGRRLVVWCNEDAPMVFPEAVRRVAGLPPEAPLAGEHLAAERILTQRGVTLLAERLPQGHGRSIAERRAITAEILQAHHDPAAIRLAIDLQGVNDATVAHMSAIYDDDVAEIAALPGVEFLIP